MTRAEYIAAMTTPDPCQELYPDEPLPLDLAEFIADRAAELGLLE